MNFIKKTFTQINNTVSSIKKNTKNAINEIQKKFVEPPQFVLEDNFIEIYPRIFWMSFPNQDIIKHISTYLNQNYKTKYSIWNVSEHKYQIQEFNNQVIDCNFPGYPNPPLSQIFLVCKSIIQWLNCDPENVAIIHCQQSRGRSALIISCLLCFIKIYNHPGECLTFFCKQTKADDSKILFPSQQLYLNYFANIMTEVQLNQKPQRLKKIIFSEIPIITRSTVDGFQEKLFKPYLQIFKDGQIVYNSIANNRIDSYKQTDMSIWFEINDVIIQDDFLIRCKHFITNELRIPIFRMMVNTAFTYGNVLRLLKKDIDFTSNVAVSDKFFIDIIFDDNLEVGSPKANLVNNGTNSSDNANQGESIQAQTQEHSLQQQQQQSQQQQQQQQQAKYKNQMEIINDCKKYQLKIQEKTVQSQYTSKNEEIIQQILKTQITEEVKANNKQDVSNFSIVEETQPTKSESTEEKHQETPTIQDEKIEKLINKIQSESTENVDDQEIDDYIDKLEKQ